MRVDELGHIQSVWWWKTIRTVNKAFGGNPRIEPTDTSTYATTRKEYAYSTANCPRKSLINPMDSKIEQIDALYTAVGSALSNWTRVEIQLYQIFGAAHVLTIMQAGGGFSSDMRIPYAVLDAIDGFSAKIRMIDRALESALGELDDEARDILSDWGKAKEKIVSLHNKCRNCLAHWTVASGFMGGAQVRLVPPPYSSREHQGVSIADIRSWEVAFIAAADRLVNIVARLTSHQGLQRKFAMQTIEQVRIALPENSPLVELIRSEFQ